MSPGFFSKIFSSKPKKEEAFLKIRVEDAPMLIEKEFLLTKKGLEDFSGKKIAEAKFLHAKSGQILEQISRKELEEKENHRLNKAALTSKAQLENQMKRLLVKIDPHERGNTLEDARAYSGESYALLVNEINSFRKNIAYTSFYLKEEMRGLGEAMQELANIFNEMNQAFAKSGELFGFEKTRALVGAVIKKKAALKETGVEKERLSKEAEEIAKKIAAQKERIGQKQGGSEFLKSKELESKMNGLMNEKQDLKTEISSLLLSIDRPLQRFRALVDSGRWRLPKEEKEMLEQFVTNPIIALKKDPKAELFKKVLNEIIKAIEEGEIELKEREKEKRLSALQEIINFDFFGGVFWKMNEIQKRQNELNKEIEANNAKKDVANEEGLLKDLERDALRLKEKIDSAEKLENDQKKEMNKELVEIKSFTEKVLKRTVLFEEEVY